VPTAAGRQRGVRVLLVLLIALAVVTAFLWLIGFAAVVPFLFG